jgi:hypothetical protein
MGIPRTWPELQNAFTVLGIVIGGLWAGYTFFVEWKDRTESGGISLQARIAAKQIQPLPDGNQHLLIAGTVTATNAGNRRACLDLSGGPIIIAQANSMPHGVDLKDGMTSKGDLPKDGGVDFGPSKRIWLSRPGVEDPHRPQYLIVDELRPGSSDSFSFVVAVDTPGWYALMFSPPRFHNELADRFHIRCGRDEDSAELRDESDIVFVKVTSNAPGGVTSQVDSSQ